MNNGKICVSVCARDTNEFIKKIKRASELADIIELRFDCLKDRANVDILATLQKIQKELKKTYLCTFRPKEQGGKARLTYKERKNFWNSEINLLETWIDLEVDIISDFQCGRFSKIICSHHDFSNVPKKLDEIYGKLSETESDIIKIAFNVNDIIDSFELWRLLEEAKPENKKIIPIAMGEAGKWTRILGLAYGSPITYASLETGNETAPGQISANDLANIYRVKELNRQTEIYGIIGNPVSHSLSPYMHNAAFKHHRLNAVYVPLEVSDVDEFIKRAVRKETREIKWNLRGFSVTVPHKETILKHIDFIGDDAKKIGAVNTVKIVEDKLHGYNTDAEGFIDPLRNSYGNLKNANIGIIGNGGAARACAYALKKEEANVTIFARDPKKAESLATELNVEFSALPTLDSRLDAQDALVNCTPLGTIGEFENQTPLNTEHIKNVNLIYDLVYNPRETILLRTAKKAGLKTIGGLEMLLAQGMKQYEIWTSLEAPSKIMRQSVSRRES